MRFFKDIAFTKKLIVIILVAIIIILLTTGRCSMMMRFIKLW